MITSVDDWWLRWLSCSVLFPHLSALNKDIARFHVTVDNGRSGSWSISLDNIYMPIWCLNTNPWVDSNGRKPWWLGAMRSFKIFELISFEHVTYDYWTHCNWQKHISYMYSPETDRKTPPMSFIHGTFRFCKSFCQMWRKRSKLKTGGLLDWRVENLELSMKHGAGGLN